MVDLVRNLQSENSEKIPMWTIYERPTDWHYGFIARMHLSLPSLTATDYAIRSPNVEYLREVFKEAGLIKVTRSIADHKTVVESWF